MLTKLYRAGLRDNERTRRVAMRIEVIEFEMACRKCGPHKTIVPVEAPRPERCVQCFLPVTRTELRRYHLDGPLPGPVSSEAWIG